MKKQIIIFSLILVASTILSFLLGVFYSKNVNNKNDSFSTTQRNIIMNYGYGFNRANIKESNMIDGEILSKDDNSITVKLKDGGSKIIIFSNSTNVLKSTQVTLNDINIGDNVIISGKANSDGSVIADSIQIRNQLVPKQDNAAQQ
ncbi:hypothetical protein KBH77_00640 [Patescibacteria group bacterium]|nr:hypothetical protein [Patescibacteria group bacterium]HOC96456.1 hypothetical protein [bacterium]